MYVSGGLFPAFGGCFRERGELCPYAWQPWGNIGMLGGCDAPYAWKLMANCGESVHSGHQAIREAGDQLASFLFGTRLSRPAIEFGGGNLPRGDK